MLNAPKNFKGVNAGMLNSPGNICFTRPQVATILACVWFGLFEFNYSSSADREKFNPSLADAVNNKNIFVIQCWMNYFKCVYDYYNTDDDHLLVFTSGIIIIKRGEKLTCPNLTANNSRITDIKICDGAMDDSSAKIRVIAASNYVANGSQNTPYAHAVFGGSLSEEELVMLIRPECMIVLLFCGLSPRNSVTVIGAEKITKYVGYGSNVIFAGNYIDPATRGYSPGDTEILYQTAITFLFAKYSNDPQAQFKNDFNSTIENFYNGMSELKLTKRAQIAINSWDYNGLNSQLKFIQMIIAATLANKSIYYYGRPQMINKFVDWLVNSKITIAELYTQTVNLIYSRRDDLDKLNKLNIFELIIDM